MPYALLLLWSLLLLLFTPWCNALCTPWCNALCMDISFVLWSTCLSSSLVHFKNGPEYLMRGTAQVFIPLISFLQHSFVSSSFLILLRYSFFIFSFISTCLMVSASKMPNYLNVSFSPSVLILSWFGNSIPSVWCLFLLFITSMAQFSMPNIVVAVLVFYFLVFQCIYLFIIFTNLSSQAGFDTRSIFMWSLTGLNSEFSFS